MKYFILILSLLMSSVSFADELDTKLEQILYPVVRVLNGQGGGSGTFVHRVPAGD